MHVWFTLLGSPVSPQKGPHPFWSPQRESGTGDPFGVLVALLSAAAKCFRAQSFATTPPLKNLEGATKHKHGMTCAAELFHLRHVRSCAASAF